MGRYQIVSKIFEFFSKTH